LQLLYSSYSIPIQTILSLLVVDVVSLVAPQYFLAASVPPHTPYEDKKLTVYTTILSATFLSLPLYYLSTKYLPLTLVSYFDAVTSLTTLPIPTLIAVNLPAGYALQTLLERYGVKGAIASLLNVLVTGTGTLYYGVTGAEIKGVQVLDTIWIVSMIVSLAATYGFVIRK